jgi:hypothetical protein
MIAPMTPLAAGEGTPVINGVYPFAGVFMTGRDEPVVSFDNKDGFAMLGVSLVDNLSPSWGFEATIAFVPDKNDSVFLLYHGNLITNLRITNRLYPYLTVGAGAITTLDSLDTETNLALNGGMGVKLRLTSATQLRIDFRDYAYFLEDDVQHWQHLIIGAGYSFNSVLFEW